MTIAALGIKIDSTEVKGGTRDLDGLTVAAGKAERAADRLPSASGRASAGVKRLGDDTRTTAGAFDRLSSQAMRSLTGIDAVMARAAQRAEHMASQIEKVTFSDLRGSDIAIYGDELDRLRERYDPLFAASKSYERELDALNRAHQVGAIDARVHGDAMASLDARYDEMANGAIRAAKAQEEASRAAMNHVSSLGQADLALQRFIDHQAGAAKATQEWGGPLANLDRELEQLRAKFNPLFAASKAYEAELDELNHAHRLGAISAQEQASALAMLDARYEQAAASANNLANSASRASAANMAHTTNLLFQAQDIAMMTAMGQSPMMLAMQQGMQVGGIFHQIGSGRQIVQALGGAVAGLLNPLNLATIATIALGSAGVQWFMNTFNSAEDATTALERHSAMLDKVLAGYDEARSAAGDILSGGQKAPEASVVSDLSIFRVDAMERYEEALVRVREEQAEWQDDIQMMVQQSAPAELTAQMQRVLDIVTEVGLSSDTTMGQLDGLHATLTLVKNSGADDAVVATAEAMLLMIENARAGRVEVDSLGGALDQLDRNIQIRISVSQVFSDAMSDINSLYMDPRSRFEQAREELRLRAQAAQESAQSMSELNALASDYERVMASINAAEAEANKKSNAKGARDAQKPFDQWGGNVEQFQQRIASQRLEIDLLGKSTFEIERQRAAFDLLNQAKQANIPITSEITDKINSMANEYAGLAVTMENVQRQADLAIQINNTLAQGFSDMFTGIISGSMTAEQAISNLLGQLGQLLINQAFMGLFGAGTGGGIGGFFAGMMSFDGGGHTGYGARSGGVDGKGGFPAILHPNETVIDHARGMAPMAGMGGGGDIYITNQINVPPGTTADVAPAIAREVTKELRKQLPDAIERHNRNPLRRAG